MCGVKETYHLRNNYTHTLKNLRVLQNKPFLENKPVQSSILVLVT